MVVYVYEKIVFFLDQSIFITQWLKILLSVILETVDWHYLGPRRLSCLCFELVSHSCGSKLQFCQMSHLDDIDGFSHGGLISCLMNLVGCMNGALNPE